MRSSCATEQPQCRLIDETYLFDNGAASAWPKHIATVKTSAPFGQEVLRGFFCNYLVCLGVCVPPSPELCRLCNHQC